MKSLRKAYRGEKGFTLVELLVVVVILGVLAAVATLAVTRFIGTGNLEAAKAELANAKTAIQTAMYEGSGSRVDNLSDNQTLWWGGGTGVIRVGGADGGDAGDSIHGLFKAEYEVNRFGEIVGGRLLATGGWSGIVWHAATNTWVAS